MEKRTKSNLEDYYLKHPEPYQARLLALKHINYACG